MQSFVGLPFKLSFFNPHLNWGRRCDLNSDPGRWLQPHGMFVLNRKFRVDVGMPLGDSGQVGVLKLLGLRGHGLSMLG
jgi:hypothetical protein